MQDAGGRNQSPVSTLQFLVRLLRWRKLILINTGVIALLAVIISLLLPNWYEARVSILPPQEELSALSAFSGSLTSTLGASGRAAQVLSGRMNLPIWASPSDYLAGILRSRRLREAVVREHDLGAVYKCDNIDQTLECFAHNIKIRVGTEGIIRVRVQDKEPERAAAIAGSCLRILDEIQRETRRSRAADVRRFVADRLEATRSELAAAEESLQAFQERYGLIIPEEQARALVQTVAKVEAERLAAVVERDALSAQAGPNHPDVQRLEARVRSLEEAKSALEGRQMKAGERGRRLQDAPRGPGIEGPAAIIDLGRLPSLSLSFLRLYRDVEIRELLFELLTQLLEQHRIQEVRDIPTIQILDRPVAPLEKVKPHRALICVIATLLAFLAGLGIAAGLERIAVLAETDPERHTQLVRLLSGLGLGFLARRR